MAQKEPLGGGLDLMVTLAAVEATTSLLQCLMMPLLYLISEMLD